MSNGYLSTLSNLSQDEIPVYILGIGVLLLIGTKLLADLRDPLRSIPGPFWAKWTPFWLVYWARTGQMHRQMIGTHKKYGRLVRTGPNEVSIANPDAVRLIYGAGGDFRKSDWYSVWQGVRKWDLFGERNESIHRAQRRLVTQIYSLSNMKKLEPYVDNTIGLFMKKMTGKGGRPINMSKWAQLFAFDVIGEITFSKRFGFMEAEKDDGAFSLIDNSLRCAAWVGYMPWVYWTNLRLTPYIGSHLAVTARQSTLLTFAAKAIAERKKRGSDHNDILAQLFDVQKEKPELDDICVTSMVASNIFAGSDSTALSLSSLIYYVARDPRCKKKLIDEIDSTAKSHNIKRGHEDIFSLEIANNMPYLQAVMWEALRCHAAVGMNLGRVAPLKGIEIDGQYIPGGTVVGVNAWVVHRDKDVFGEDADEFRPERWMEESERVSQMRRVFFTFGGGSRFCLGKNVAWLEVSKFIPTLFYNFDIELAEPHAALQELALSFVKVENFHVTLKPRQS